MNVITFDIPLLIAGFLLLGWAKLFRTDQYFQILCQFVATFAAQYSFGVSWSLARLVPIVAATSVLGKNSLGLKIYLPFIIYMIISSIIGSFFWNIPPNVQYWYGDGRVYVQLFNFLILAAVTITLTNAIFQQGGVRLLIYFLQLAALIHGLASLYQIAAGAFNWPLLGISRGHGLTIDGGAGDVAAFLSTSGNEVLRPGGLMGEPKSAAVLFGIIVLFHIFRQKKIVTNFWENILGTSAFVLSIVGFLAAFSTSAIFGFVCSLAMFMIFFASGIDWVKILLRISFILAIMFIGWYMLYGGGLSDFRDIILERSIDRIDNELDPPVQASINKMMDNFLVALLGVGLGGSSFVVMEYLKDNFNYAFAPNIGFILILIEMGIIGSVLFLGVFFRQVSLIGLSSLVKIDSEVRDLLIIGVSTMLLCLAGSGIPMGFPLAVACVAVAAKKVYSEASSIKMQRIKDVRFHR